MRKNKIICNFKDGERKKKETKEEVQYNVWDTKIVYEANRVGDPK